MLLKIIKTSTKEGTSADLSPTAFSNLGKEINFLTKRFRKNTKGWLIQLELVKSRILIEFFSLAEGDLDSTQRFPFFFLIQKKKQNKTKQSKKLGAQGIVEALFARSEQPIVPIPWLSFTR